MSVHTPWNEIKHKRDKEVVITQHPEYVREFLVTCCAYGDEDLVPTCLFAAIKPPDDLPNEDVPMHIRQLMAQIVNEMPMHMRSGKVYGKMPDVGDLFWECAPNPIEVEQGSVISWLSDAEYLQRLHSLGSSTTSFLDVRGDDDDPA